MCLFLPIADSTSLQKTRMGIWGCLQAALASAAAAHGLKPPLVLDLIAFKGCYHLVAEILMPEQQQEAMEAELLAGLDLPAAAAEHDVAFGLQQHHQQEEQQVQLLQAMGQAQGLPFQEQLLAEMPEGWGLAGLQIGAVLDDPAGSGGGWGVQGLFDESYHHEQQFLEVGSAAPSGSVLKAPYLEPPVLSMDWDCSASLKSNSNNSSRSCDQDRLLRLIFPSSLLVELLQQGPHHIRVIVGTEGGQEILCDHKWVLDVLLAQQAERPEDLLRMAGDDFYQEQQSEGGAVHLQLQLNFDLLPDRSRPIGCLAVACLVGTSSAAGEGGYGTAPAVAGAGEGHQHHCGMELVLSTMPLLILPIPAAQELQQLAARAAAAGLPQDVVYQQVLLPVMKDLAFVGSNCRGQDSMQHPSAELLLSQVDASLSAYCAQLGLSECLALLLEVRECVHRGSQSPVEEAAGGLGLMGLEHQQQPEQQDMPHQQQSPQQLDVMPAQGSGDISVPNVCSTIAQQHHLSAEGVGEQQLQAASPSWFSLASVCYVWYGFPAVAQELCYNQWKSGALKLLDLLVLLACAAYVLLLLLPFTACKQQQQSLGAAVIESGCMLVGQLLVVLGSRCTALSSLQQQRGRLLLGAASVALLLNCHTLVHPLMAAELAEGITGIGRSDFSVLGMSILLQLFILSSGMGAAMLCWVMIKLRYAVAAVAVGAPSVGLQQSLCTMDISVKLPSLALLLTLGSGVLSVWLEARMRQRFLNSLPTY
jgi:hypothetical protein